MQNRVHGLSLTELLIVLSLLGLLLFNMNLPGFGRSRETKSIDAVMTDIVSAVSMARQAAVSESKLVTFCRSNNGQQCLGKWHEGSIIFTDSNGDRIINGDDRLLTRFPAITPSGRLSFNSFRNRQYLQLTPFGMTNYQNGNFTYCPDNGDVTLARQVIVSVTGRTRYAKDRDGDGVVENSQGEAVECD